MGRVLLSDIDLLRRLVGIDSTSARSNLPIATEIASYLQARADAITFIESPDEEKANLLIRFGPEDDGGLILSGHMDAVPAVETNWESDPFVLTDRGETLAGRGTADMKGFLAVAMNAAADAGSLRRPLYLLFTYDEEAGTRGARQFALQWDRSRPLPRHCVIGEPTEFRTVRTHKGHLKLRIRTRGRSAHSGYPHLGDNAIEKMTPALAALARLRRELEAERSAHSDLFPDAPFVPLNIATVHGGAAVNIVPDSCEVEVGIRLLPGLRSEEMADRVRRAIGGEAVVEIVNDSPPMLLGSDAAIYQAAREVSGAGQARESVNFASDAGWLQSMGMECILFGPGSIEVAHRANEFVPKADLARAADLTRALIRRFCT